MPVKTLATDGVPREDQALNYQPDRSEGDWLSSVH